LREVRSLYEISIAYREQKIDPADDNVDVEVRLESGERYIATFFTLKNIQRLTDGYKASGECNSGQYFWAANMLIIRDLSEKTIQQTIADLVANGEFKQVFSGPFID
jgi:outer membrane translocation and assembly module TamA